MAKEAGDADRELVRECIEGQEQAWEELVKRTAPSVVWVVRRTLERFGLPAGDPEVREVSSRVYGLLWEEDRRRLHAFTGPCTLKTWVKGLARMTALGHAGAERRRRERELSVEPQTTVPSPETPLERRELQDAVRSALDRLEEEDRTLLRLLLEEGRSYRRIARETGVPHRTLADRMARLKDRLSSMLRDHLFCL